MIDDERDEYVRQLVIARRPEVSPAEIAGRRSPSPTIAASRPASPSKSYWCLIEWLTGGMSWKLPPVPT